MTPPDHPGPLTDDSLLGGRVRIWQPAQGFRAGSDAVLLAAACPARPGEAALDLGCGVGSAALCLAARVPGLRLAGLEVQADYAALARANAARNGVAMEVVSGDIATMPAELRRGFDQVIANPPYYPPGAGTPATDAGRETALREALPLAGWVDAATRRLRPGGWLTLILGTDRLPAALAALDARMGSLAVLPLAPRADRPALRVILRARKGGRAAFRLLAPLILHAGDRHPGDLAHDSEEARAILWQGAAIRRFD